MKQIKMIRDLIAIVDDNAFQEISKYHWYPSFNPHTNTYYAKTRWVLPNKKVTTMQMSRLVVNRVPIGYVVDHINHDTLDNRLSNLRIVTIRENSQNRLQKVNPPTSSFVGVSYDKLNKKYRADIQINGKTKNLGRFKTELEASDAYKDALKHIGCSVDNILTESNWKGLVR